MSQASVERIVCLAAQPSSAGQARRAVREVLHECCRQDWLDAARLAVSELVTNAVLHAHTSIELRICCGTELRVEVADLSPAWPTQHDYGVQATTGRGMGLVAAVTNEHGVTPLEDGGKAVWFVLRTLPAAAETDHFGDWSAVIADLSGQPGTGQQRVRLLSLPSTLWLAAEQRHDALLRELALLPGAAPALTYDLAAADAARSKLATAAMQALSAARAAENAPDPLPANHPARLAAVPAALDIELSLSLEDGKNFGALQDVLDDSEQRAVDGQMLSRPGLPEIIALRDWACEQVIAQLNGQVASPWLGTEAERFTELQGSDQEDWSIDWDTGSITESSESLIAADEGNRIIAISRPLAQALGWAPKDLVGRRVVAIVPPRYREAHVAGFTRHLTTGQDHAIGVDLELPVWKRDGTELLCSLFITVHRTSRGRNIYVSRLTPKATQ